MRTTFEDRLLVELQGEVARAAGARRRRAGAGLIGAGVIGAVVLGGAVPWPGEPAPAPRAPIGGPAVVVPAAFSVTADAPDEVIITVHRPDDADGLEQRLRDAGIAAEVDYIPIGMMCRGPRYTGDGSEPPELLLEPDDEGLGSLTVRPSDLAGDTLVLEIYHGDAIDAHAWMIGVVAGPVAPCELVESPDAPVLSENGWPPR